jgi:hypothetical protein
MWSKVMREWRVSGLLCLVYLQYQLKLTPISNTVQLVVVNEKPELLHF